MIETTASSESQGDDTAKKKTVFPCDVCGRVFSSKGGRTNHQRKCKQDDNFIGNNKKNEVGQEGAGEEASVLTSNGGKGDVIETPVHKSPPLSPDGESRHEFFYWGKIPGTEFNNQICIAYEQIVYWKRNLFLVPTGNAGKTFIKETTKLINHFVDDSAMKCIAMKALMVMPALLLQKPSKSSKAKDHSNALQRIEAMG